MIGDALDVLEKYIKDGVDLNIEMCKFTSRCYELFLNQQLPISVRLTAIKCIGYSLSNAEPSFVLQSLNTILAPRLQRLQGIVDGQCTSSSSSLEALEAECLFEISVFSSLMATLKIKIKSESDSNLNLSVDTESPALIVLQQSIPFFRDLIAKFSSSETLVDKVCDALRSGLAVVDRNYALIIKYYCEVIDEILLKHVDIVSNFAKSVILIFASTDVSSILFSSLVKWLEEINRTGESEIAEGYIDLIYHLIKKSWNLFLVDQNNSLSALENVVNIALKNLAKNPSNPLLTRKSAALLTILILKASDIFDELFQRNAQRIVTILFSQIKIEMIQATIESIAEALMSREYCQNTQGTLLTAPRLSLLITEISYIAELPYGTSHFVAILKECYRKRQFKQLCIVFNQSVRKELQSG
ncbi:unnamed protein product [Dracunculus medinensis]|uniref:Fanconi anemia group I protein n=1 Tax=Dracunculus medinensis TaxID=318479 RepID=A0A158Q3J7_DRAME|nr:unnamed protein product [Dracunculus medinensis]